ncbi:MAG: hypothetical protein WAP57_09960, partial [Aquabacterium commune]|uniref:hypothetical protein n=1 Tax=Aquabacterium commune TaxID=70586 RepID=UPI003BAFAE82
VGQQAGQQFLRYFVLLGCHCVCGQAGSRLRWIVRLHKILHTLFLLLIRWHQFSARVIALLVFGERLLP